MKSKMIFDVELDVTTGRILRQVPVELLDPDSLEVLRHYPHYMRLLVENAWELPVLTGRLPKSPDADSVAEDRGMYSLWAMLLFRPWRSVVDDILQPAGLCDADTTGMELPEAWQRLTTEYDRWYEGLRMAAEPFYKWKGTSMERPAYNDDLWWACHIFPKLRNLHGVCRRKPSADTLEPDEVFGLPVESAPVQVDPHNKTHTH